MSVIVDLSGLDRLIRRVGKLKRLDAVPLMASWMKIIEEDNRKGVLAGLDKDGNPMPAVTYRPKGPTVKIGAKSAAKFRNNAKAGAKRGEFFGFGPSLAGLNNNLSRAEYEQLTGPPLAPRGQFSRVITNLKLGFTEDPFGIKWTAYGVWFEVVSVKGRPFLQYHFKGIRYRGWHGSSFKRRNLAGVRPAGRDKARRAAVAWMRDQIRSA